MGVTRITDDLFLIPGLVNIYILKLTDGLAVLDTGFPGSTKKIVKAVTTLGRSPADIQHILLSHCHPDHIGSAAELKRATGASVWAHPLDVPMMEAGTTIRQPMCPSPGLRNRILARLLRGRVNTVEPVSISGLLEDGVSPPFAPDLLPIHVPGHCAGQLAFLWQRHGGILFPADACVHRRGLTLPVATEEPDTALASLNRLGGFDFDKICVMHGKPILSDGAAQFRRTIFDTFPHI